MKLAPSKFQMGKKVVYGGAVLEACKQIWVTVIL